MTSRDVTAGLAPRFGRGEASALTELMLHALKGWSRTDMLIHDDEQLSPFIEESIRSMTARLEKGEPIQYITGEAYFYGLWFHVDPRVLIPRPETAELVDMIADLYRDRTDLRVLDIATGSGCIAIALARTLKFAQVEGLDISSAALMVARENDRALKAGVRFFEADMAGYVPDEDSFDIMVSNPPYIDDSEKGEMEPTVKDYEPSGALFVPDAAPLIHYKEIVRIALRGLRKGGRLFLEINPRHADAMASLLEGEGFSDVEISLDIHGRKRFASARK